MNIGVNEELKAYIDPLTPEEHEALERSRKGEQAKYLYSFDMLGEAAFTQADADRYFAAYRDAIGAIGAHSLISSRSALRSPCVMPSVTAGMRRSQKAARADVVL